MSKPIIDDELSKALDDLITHVGDEYFLEIYREHGDPHTAELLKRIYATVGKMITSKEKLCNTVSG